MPNDDLPQLLCGSQVLAYLPRQCWPRMAEDIPLTLHGSQVLIGARGRRRLRMPSKVMTRLPGTTRAWTDGS